MNNTLPNINQLVKIKRTNILIMRFIASIFVIILHARYLISSRIMLNIVEVITLPAVNLFIIATSVSSFNKTKNNYRNYFKLICIVYIFNFILNINFIFINGEKPNYLNIFLPFFSSKIF